MCCVDNATYRTSVYILSPLSFLNYFGLSKSPESWVWMVKISR